MSDVIVVLTELTDLVYVSPFVFTYEKVLELVPFPKLPVGVSAKNPPDMSMSLSIRCTARDVRRTGNLSFLDC